MKLIDFNRCFVDAHGNPLMEVVKECSIDAALAGHGCDAIMLNLVDLARLQTMSEAQLRLWLGIMQTKIRISFDPNVVK